ncbi:MAG: hypothetical protein AB8G96_01520 [Phycisphaerales bacterium]
MSTSSFLPSRTSRSLAGLAAGACALAVGGLAVAMAPTSTPTSAVSLASIGSMAEETVDIVLLNDGREFQGEILEETNSKLVIKANIAGITTTMTFSPAEIAKIFRDQAVAGGGDEVEEDDPWDRNREADADDDGGSFGVQRVERREGVTGLYIIPWKGQAGTDINPEIYREMVDDIRLHDPDYLVIEVECEDYELGFFTEQKLEEIGQTGIDSLDEYRDILDLFHDDLRDIPQVVWVKQAIGMSSGLVLGWDKIYMKSDSNLEGIDLAARNFLGAQNDPDKFGKFREAYMGLLRGFALRSGRRNGYEMIVDAMVIPSNQLSATWRGRQVEWALDGEGEYKIDVSGNRVAKFSAQTAENFGISSGTADSLDDVALLLGLREYDVIDGQSEEIFEEYREDWRKTFSQAEDSLKDYQKLLRRAQGPDYIPNFTKAKDQLKRVIRYMERYDAVRIRLGQQYGVDITSLKIRIYQMEEQLKILRQQDRGNRGGGGRRGAPGGGGFGNRG